VFDTAEPGQFVLVDTGPERALRRPFSVAGVTADGDVELLIALRGDGTRALADLPVGSLLTIMGPLGRGFMPPASRRAAHVAPHAAGATQGASEAAPWSPDADPWSPEAAPWSTEAPPAAVVVAGGIGVAGVRFLVQRLSSAGTTATLFVGARTGDTLLHTTLPEPDAVHLATDDGTMGFRGTVCDLFAAESATLPVNTKIYGCGPRAMLDSLSAIADERGMACELSLEEMMACGVGACRGCVVSTVDGYRTVCKDGPVFDASVLVPERCVIEVADG